VGVRISVQRSASIKRDVATGSRARITNTRNNRASDIRGTASGENGYVTAEAMRSAGAQHDVA
jgi:hypothetical protein